MAQLGNTPLQHTVIRAEARKAFSLGLRLCTQNGKPVNLTDCVLTIVAKPVHSSVDSDSDNLLLADATATLTEPTEGWAQFELQAQSLDHAPGEYPFAIVLRTATNYTSVLVKGTLEIVSNTEYASADVVYSDVASAQTLDIVLRRANVISVVVGHSLPPGMGYVRDDLMERLESFDPSSVAIMPPGGTSGHVLTKLADGDYAVAWRPVGNGELALDATGLTGGEVPTALGDDTWTWLPGGLNAALSLEGTAPVADGDGGWTWQHVERSGADWDAESSDPGFIENKPSLGTAAAADVGDFIAADTIVSNMEGIHFQTTVPVTGVEGHIYFVYEA